MRSLWKTWLYVVLLCSPCQGGGDVVCDLTEGAEHHTVSAAAIPSPPVTLNCLPFNLVAEISCYLNPSDHCHFKGTSKLIHTTLSAAAVQRKQLYSWGLRIEGVDGGLKQEESLILSASSLLKSLWDAGRYLDIVKLRQQIALQLVHSASAFDLENWQYRALLTQAVLLGGNEALKQLEKLLEGRELEDAVNLIVQLYESDTAWLKRSCIDSLFQATLAVRPEISGYLLSLKGVALLPRFCRAGVFLVLADIKSALEKGSYGFALDADLSARMAGYLSQSKGVDEWCMVAPKKKHSFPKITLQELLPDIMTAISEREFE